MDHSNTKPRTFRKSTLYRFAGGIPLPDPRRGLAVLLLPALFSFASLRCTTAPGPPFPSLSEARPLPPEGRYYFDLPYRLQKGPTVGELTLRHTRREERARFRISMAGIDRTGALRLRTYEGRAFRIGADLVELKAENCYIFGKREATDRIVPLEGWDCDHLIFRFRSPDSFRKPGPLLPVPGDRTVHTLWMGSFDLFPLPPRAGSGRGGVTFAGQILRRQEDGRILLWGREGGRILRDGQRLRVVDRTGRPRGLLKVSERPGDFILATEMGGALGGVTEEELAGLIVYTTEDLRSSPALF